MEVNDHYFALAFCTSPLISTCIDPFYSSKAGKAAGIPFLPLIPPRIPSRTLPKCSGTRCSSTFPLYPAHLQARSRCDPTPDEILAESSPVADNHPPHLLPPRVAVCPPSRDERKRMSPLLPRRVVCLPRPLAGSSFRILAPRLQLSRGVFHCRICSGASDAMDCVLVS